MQSLFSKYGIPQELISDNGPWYASGEFPQFAKKHNRAHTTAFPHSHESNGLAENAGIIK